MIFEQFTILLDSINEDLYLELALTESINENYALLVYKFIYKNEIILLDSLQEIYIKKIDENYSGGLVNYLLHEICSSYSVSVENLIKFLKDSISIIDIKKEKESFENKIFSARIQKKDLPKFKL